MRFLLLFAVLSSLCVAQEPAQRGLAFGLVRDLNGDPWTAAQVTLLSRPIPGNEHVGSADLIEVETDERGRFRADVLPHRPYSVWAVQGGDETYRHTGIVENVFAAVPIILQEGEPRDRKRLLFRGTEAWSDMAPLRFQVVESSDNGLILPLEVDRENQTVLPEIAGPSCEVEVYGESGQLLWQQGFPLTTPWGGVINLVSIPPPFPILVSVGDKAGTTPLVGAEIRQRVRNGLAPVATTGTDGIAVLKLALPRAADGSAIWRRVELIAEAEDHSPGSLLTVKMDLSEEKDAEGLRAARDVDAHAGLEPAPMLSGRVLLNPEVPASEIDLVLYGRYASFRNGSSTAGSIVRFLSTDADGRFTVPSPRAGNGFRLCAVLDETHLALLFPGESRLPHPVVLLAHDGQRTPERGLLGDLRVDELCPVDIAVTHRDRTPAPHALVGCAEVSQPNQNLDPSMFVADRHGRQRILMPSTNQLLVGARHEGAGEILSTELNASAGNGMPVSLEVVLDEPSTIRGSVFSTDGRPVPEVMITCFPTNRNRNTNRPARSTVRPAPVDQNAIRISSREQWETNWSLTSQLLEDMLAYTDENGDFSLPVPSSALQYFVRAAFVREGRAHLSSTIAVRFRDKESERVDLTIDLR